MSDGNAEVKDCAPEADDDEGNDVKPVSGKLPQSQRPGGKKRMVAAFVAFVGAGYSVSMFRSLPALHKRCCEFAIQNDASDSSPERDDSRLASKGLNASALAGHAVQPRHQDYRGRAVQGHVCSGLHHPAECQGSNEGDTRCTSP